MLGRLTVKSHHVLLALLLGWLPWMLCFARHSLAEVGLAGLWSVCLVVR